MNGNAQPNFLYLNRDNVWLDFQTSALELAASGVLTLAALPISEGPLPASLAALPTPTGPAGIAVAADGTVYFTDPNTNRIFKIAPCCIEPSGQTCTPPAQAPQPCADARPPARVIPTQSECDAAPILCVGGAGSQPTRLSGPRGILLHKKRRAVVVADSGNHRLQLFDPESFQLVGIWGQANPTGTPEPGDAPGLLDTPWTLAQDDDGNLYVVDYGNQRVQKFDVRGKVIPSFWDNATATKPQSPPLSEPGDVAVVDGRVLIADASQHTIFVFDADGNFQHSFGTSDLNAPMGIAGDAQAIYVGDNSARRILVFKPDGTLLGPARGYQGPVAALALDAQNGLWVHPGGDCVPFALRRNGAFVTQGRLVGGPFKNPSPHPDQWHQLAARVELPTDAHIQFFVYSTSQNTAPGEPWNSPVVDLRQAQTQRHFKESSQNKWLRVPLDVTACLIPGQAFENVWVAAEFSSEGLSTPALEQLRLDLDHQSFAEYLPTIYRAGMQIPERSTVTDQEAIDRQAARTRQFLTRFLSLFQSEYTDVENLIAGLASLFDAAAVPVEFLDWLASWLALDLDASRPEWERRQLLADAFALYARRGTVEGLRLALQRFARVDAQIQEPLQQISWWALPADESSPPLDTATSVLGFTTMLAPSEPQGAVVGTTATLDASHLITQEEYGAPLFSEFAHQFSVRIYRGATYSEPGVAQLRALIEREKPAHVLYSLCVIEPQMRVGFQAQLGIDTVIAGPPPPSNLGQGEIVLGGEMPGRMGEQSRIGQTTRLV